MFCYLDLGIYVDTHNASEATDRISVSGVTVVWKCTRGVLLLRPTNKCVTLSTTEAQNVATRDGGKRRCLSEVLLLSRYMFGSLSTPIASEQRHWEYSKVIDLACQKRNGLGTSEFYSTDWYG